MINFPKLVIWGERDEALTTHNLTHIINLKNNKIIIKFQKTIFI